MNRRGFTLIELLIGIAILAFTVSSALLLVQNQLLGSLASDAQIVADRLQEAESRAISGAAGSSWGIHFDNATSTPFYALFAGNTYASPSSTFYLSGTVEFSAPAAGTTTDIVFSKLTGATAATTVITLRLKSNHNSTTSITVTPQGQITVQ